MKRLILTSTVAGLMNGLKITDVINDNLQTVFDKSEQPLVALDKMSEEVQKLLTR